MKGNTIPRRLSVDYISFSAHVDGRQNTEFIEQVKAQHVVSTGPFFKYLYLDLTGFEKVLVHGEQTAMGRLRASLQQRYKDREEEVKIHTPRNCETLRLTFRGERVAKVCPNYPAVLQLFNELNLFLGYWNIGSQSSESEYSSFWTSGFKRLLLYSP